MKDRMKMIKKVMMEIYNDIKRILPAIVVILIAYIVMFYFYRTNCPVRLLCGYPCPGCGLTRAGISVLLFRFRSAWELNASIYLWMPLIAFYLFDRYIWKKGRKYIMPLAVFVSLVTLAYFVYRFYTIYPGPEPMQYHYNNMLYQLWSLKKI